MPQGLDFQRYDLTRLLAQKNRPQAYLAPAKERAGARLAAYHPITVDERLAAFDKIGFHPHGLYVPDSEHELFTPFRAQLREIGDINDVDERVKLYQDYQIVTAGWEREGVPGAWMGQQAVARSDKRFRFVAWGRRSGKTLYSSREAIAVMISRNRATVWVCAATMSLVERCFNMIKLLIKDLGIPVVRSHDTEQSKFIEIEGGSTVRGVSMDITSKEAGDAVDLAIVDEAKWITGDSWRKRILPPLTDRNGRALLISTYEGEENFFFEQSEHAQSSEEWAFFEDSSWDVNFYMYPQGRRSPAIRAAEAEMADDPGGFLEEFGSIPSPNQRRIYPQHRDAVHVGLYPYQRGWPVHLCIDPSSGANPYAVGVIQDFGTEIHVIDEYYQAGVGAEDVMTALNERPWRQDAGPGTCDSAVPYEIVRWNNPDFGFQVEPVFNKPLVEARIPIYRHMLRDPQRFFKLQQEIKALVLEDWGWEEDEITRQEERTVMLEVEERLSSHRLNARLIERLRDCSHLFINEDTCPNLIKEHKTYAYRRPRSTDQTQADKPLKKRDHLVDAIGYYIWQYKRFDLMGRDNLESYSSLAIVTDGPYVTEEDDGYEVSDEMKGLAPVNQPVLVPHDGKSGSFLEMMRNRYDRGGTARAESYNLLEKV